MDKAQYRKLMDWMKNDCHLQNWWEEEFAKSDAEIDSATRCLSVSRKRRLASHALRGLSV